jgi:transcriptional regulator with XRE-family HTH domain
VTDPRQPSLSYRKIVGRNISAARGRLRLSQLALGERMRALGFSAWQQQTVAASETARRRVTAEEILGLALALDATIAALMTAANYDGYVELPDGKKLGAISVERQAGRGVNDHAVQWSDDGRLLVGALAPMPGLDPFDLPGAPTFTEVPPDGE